MDKQRLVDQVRGKAFPHTITPMLLKNRVL